MNTNTTGTTVTFSDVLWKFISLWKLAIVLAATGFIIGSLYVSKTYAKREVEYTPLKTEYDRVMKEYEDEKSLVVKFNTAKEDEKINLAAEAEEKWTAQLSSEQLSQIENALSIKKLINENAEYQNSSILLNLDPYSVNTLTMVFEATSETTQVSSILNTLNSYVSSEEFITEIAEKQGWDIVANEKAIYTELFSASVQNGNQLLITVQCAKTDNLDTLADAINSAITKKSQELTKSKGMHSISETSRNKSVKTNNTLATTKSTIQNQQVGYTTQLNNLKNVMKNYPEQYNLYVLKSGMEDGNMTYVELIVPKEPEVQEPGKLRSKNAYRLIGLILGFVVTFVYAYIIMLFSGRMEKTEELTTLYGMNPAGYIYRNRKIPVDTLITKLKKGKNRPADNGLAIKLLSDGIAAMCRKEEINKLALVSTSINNADKSSFLSIAENLKKEGIELCTEGNILKDAEFKEKMIKNDAAIIAETVGIAKNRYINEEKQVLDGLGLKILCAFGIE